MHLRLYREGSCIEGSHTSQCDVEAKGFKRRFAEVDLAEGSLKYCLREGRRRTRAFSDRKGRETDDTEQAESLRDEPLDVLLHNAGVMQQSHARRTTACRQGPRRTRNRLFIGNSSLRRASRVAISRGRSS